MKIINYIIIIFISLLLIPAITLSQSIKSQNPIKVGWIGAMSGATAKWGAYQAALLGLEDVNTGGGINGQPLQILFEDTGCNGKTAVTAFKKLTGIDKVKFILGGHCSPDSLAFAPLAEQMKIISIAAISSTPKLSDQGDYIFRVTPVSTKLADLIAPYAYQKLGIRKITVIHEQTDYVVPVVEKLESNFKELGGLIVSTNAFNPGETDFRSLLIKASQNSDAIYLGVQAPDTALILMKQIKELGIKQLIFGNEQFAGALLSTQAKEEQNLLQGVILAEPLCDLKAPEVSQFSEKYRKRYKVDSLPFGCYTGEPYDSIQLLAKALKHCGENVLCIKDELYKIHDYPGASGSISFNSKGDVEKKYVLKKITGSQLIDL